MFYSNDDATAFTADMVKIKELTPENVLNALADKGVIDKGIKINKFEVSEVDGAAAMANPPVPVEKVKGTIKNAERRTRYRSYYY